MGGVEALLEEHGPVEELVLDEELEAHLMERGFYDKHRVSLTEIAETHMGHPRFFLNEGQHRAPVVMVGPTAAGRLLCVPVEPAGRWGAWRPVTAFEANRHHHERYMEAGGV